LSQPKTIAALKQMFGGTEIDLTQYGHQREFFRQLGRLLMENDQLLHDALVRASAKFRALPAAEYALTRWQVARRSGDGAA